MINVHEHRLRTLAHFLETQVKDQQFDISEYATRDILEEEYDHPCGSRACALGWCATIWPSQFRLRFNSRGDRHTGELLVGGSPIVSSYDKSIQKWFFISESEAESIFSAVHSHTRQDVIALLESAADRLALKSD